MEAGGQGGGCPQPRAPRLPESCRVPDYAGSPRRMTVVRADLATFVEVDPA
jgi:hypothetical protein